MTVLPLHTQRRHQGQQGGADGQQQPQPQVGRSEKREGDCSTAPFAQSKRPVHITRPRRNNQHPQQPDIACAAATHTRDDAAQAANRCQASAPRLVGLPTKARRPAQRQRCTQQGGVPGTRPRRRLRARSAPAPPRSAQRNMRDCSCQLAAAQKIGPLASSSPATQSSPLRTSAARSRGCAGDTASW